MPSKKAPELAKGDIIVQPVWFEGRLYTGARQVSSTRNRGSKVIVSFEDGLLGPFDDEDFDREDDVQIR